MLQGEDSAERCLNRRERDAVGIDGGEVTVGGVEAEGGVAILGHGTQVAGAGSRLEAPLGEGQLRHLGQN